MKLVSSWGGYGSVICCGDLPWVTYSICAVWWWNLWLSAFLQWKWPLNQIKSVNTEPSLQASCSGGREGAHEGVVQTAAPPQPHIDLTFIIHHRLSQRQLNKSNSPAVCPSTPHNWRERDVFTLQLVFARVSSDHFCALWPVTALMPPPSIKHWAPPVATIKTAFIYGEPAQRWFSPLSKENKLKIKTVLFFWKCGRAKSSVQV